jgi:uncharacterized membrane protein (UPF0127 family)
MPDFCQLADRNTGQIILPHLEIAATFWRRFWGLQFRSSLTEGSGLLIVPCNSIHTCWMRFAIDVAFCDSAGMVLAMKKNVRPWRATFPVRGAKIAIEFPATLTLLHVGQQVRLIWGDSTAIPKHLQCLC